MDNKSEEQVNSEENGKSIVKEQFEIDFENFLSIEQSLQKNLSIEKFNSISFIGNNLCVEFMYKKYCTKSIEFWKSIFDNCKILKNN